MLKTWDMWARSPYSKFQTSLNVNGEWKGFDFDILLQSGLGRTVALTGVYTSTGSVGIMDNTAFTRLFYHGGNSPRFIPENSWRPDNPNAEFPRLSLVTVSNNNGFSSTFWYRNGNYSPFEIVPTRVHHSRSLYAQCWHR